MDTECVSDTRFWVSVQSRSTKATSHQFALNIPALSIYTSYRNAACAEVARNISVLGDLCRGWTCPILFGQGFVSLYGPLLFLLVIVIFLQWLSWLLFTPVISNRYVGEISQCGIDMLILCMIYYRNSIFNP